jgi:hypothetical protein
VFKNSVYLCLLMKTVYLCLLMKTAGRPEADRQANGRQVSGLSP